MQGDFIQKPPSFPYIPGGDLSGIVEEVSPEGEAAGFTKGDRVIALYGDLGPRGALAEYALVKVAHAARLPPALSADAGAALPSSALTAAHAAELVRKDDRVLVIGGAGGVGAHLVQLARHAGAAFVAATSTQAAMLTELGVDRVIDYRNERWWEVAAFIEQPFTVVFDCVGGKQAWRTARRARALAPRARYYSTVMGAPRTPLPSRHRLCSRRPHDARRHACHAWRALAAEAGPRAPAPAAPRSGDNAYFEIHSPLGILKTMLPVLWRSLVSSIGSGPRYRFVLGLAAGDGRLARVVQLAADGAFRPVLEPECPLPFTEEGVRRAFDLQKSNHAHGKVVVHVADE